MKLKERNLITVCITDRGVKFSIKKETEGDPRRFMQAHLTKYRLAYNLSRDFTFQITEQTFIGYSGTP